MSPSAPQDDRRRLRRFPAAELHVRFHTGRGWLKGWRKAQAYDFTRSGVCLITRRPLTVGQQLRLKLVLRLDHGEIVQNALVAAVINQQNGTGQRTPGYRYGLQFDYQANRHMRAMQTRARLGRMEGVLDRMARLAERKESGEALLAQFRQQPQGS
ncbi:MAG: hypothetical protein EA349_05040 [Halomonadaceae bacterium]|nr:MAG: hypothetical protein EA349_05040 [Halomonadaceae bacterium]